MAVLEQPAPRHDESAPGRGADIEVALAAEEGGSADAASKGGRPKLGAEKRRRHKLTVSLNDDEMRRVEERAAQAGQPVRVFLRAAALGARFGVADRGEVLRQLGRIRVHLGEVAERAGAGSGTITVEALDAVLAALRDLRDRL